jgi:hypothetical protein
MAPKPKTSSSFAEKELEKVEKQFDDFENQVKDVSADRTFNAPVDKTEMQTKMSQNEIARAKDRYLTPKKKISSPEKFNENFREAWNFSKEFVHFIAENKECIGESIDLWTKPYAGVPAEEWVVPCNTPVWGPRYLAEQIKRKYYNRLVMNEARESSIDGTGTYYGTLVKDTTVHRLDCHPVIKQRSVFMGSTSFG